MPPGNGRKTAGRGNGIGIGRRQSASAPALGIEIGIGRGIGKRQRLLLVPLMSLGSAPGVQRLPDTPWRGVMGTVQRFDGSTAVQSASAASHVVAFARTIMASETSIWPPGAVTVTLVVPTGTFIAAVAPNADGRIEHVGNQVRADRCLLADRIHTANFDSLPSDRTKSCTFVA